MRIYWIAAGEAVRQTFHICVPCISDTITVSISSHAYSPISTVKLEGVTLAQVTFKASKHSCILYVCLINVSVKIFHLDIKQAACLARCNGAKVDMLRHGTFTESQFRQQVLDACTSGEEHMVVSYSRRSFQQTGDGHFSPIGGYHRGRDLVLILDVARFKYPPHWVPLSLLYEAMSKLDPITGLPRGYLLLSPHSVMDSAMFTLDIRSEGWQEAKNFVEALPDMLIALVRDGLQLDPEAKQMFIQRFLKSIPWPSVSNFLVVRGHWVEDEDRCVPTESRQALMAELSSMSLFQVKNDWRLKLSS